MNANLPQLEVVFHEALARTDAAERAAYLDATCAGDVELRRRVDELLAAHAERGEFLGGTDGATAGYFAPSIASPNLLGTVIAGRYKLLEIIGEGGMGTVYMAEQIHPVRRRVAVKIIKPGMDSKGVLARFEAERQALALMDHPNIARVLDAATTEQGSPFFIMELVKGVPITRFCDERKLSPRERLELFVPVCQAIQHAHQKGVIHRDIKPSNVLIAVYDERPVPKVIDFGVAKATGQPLTEQTLHTGFGAIVGTPEYMSPEQATFNQLDIDTRSDVYALGVLLYELLTGTTPVDKGRLKEAAVLEVLRIVREDDPPRPSVKLSTIDARASIAASRGTEPEKLSKLLRGELDWIVLKALEKDRNRRYDTAASLAKDVQRYLADEIVEARPPGARYRTWRFIRKHVAAILITEFIVLLLVGWIATMIRSNSRLIAVLNEATTARLSAEEQRKEADKQRLIAEARAVTESDLRFEAVEQRGLALAAKMEASEAAQEATRALRHAERNEQAAKAAAAEARSVLKYFQAGVLGPGREETIGERVAELEPLLDTAPPQSPGTAAGVRLTYGLVHLGWGETDQGLAQIERALAEHRKSGFLNPSSVQDAMTAAAVIRGLESSERAAKILMEVLPIVREQSGSGGTDTLAIMHELATSHEAAGHYADATSVWQELVAILRRPCGEKDRASFLGEALDGLGRCMKATGRHADAEPLFRERLDLLGEQGRGSPEWVTTSTQLAACLRSRKNTMEAESVLLGIFAVVDDFERKGGYVAHLRSQKAAAIQLLIEIYEATDQAKKAAEWRGRLSR